jgi:endonuclease YncB( thermonuclease family)
LVADRGNDGDSFKVRTPAGETLHLRLYFVDAPESAVKRYRNGDSNEKRLSYQSEYFSGLSQSKTVEAGQAAKQWVRERLAASSGFTVSTRHESVYDSGRIYALVSLREGGRERWLHELLVERGLVRIYTQGTDLPDGTSRGAQTRRLKGLEKDAKAARKGAWGLAS